MITTIAIIGFSAAVIAAVYFAYKSNKTSDQYLDQKVKFESVIAYSKSLEEKLQTTAKATKPTKTEKIVETTKSGKTVKLADAPKRRGRKPSGK